MPKTQYKAEAEESIPGFGVVYRADAPWNEALKALAEEGIKLPASIRQLAYAKIQAGKESSLCTNGSYTMHGVLSVSGKAPLFVRSFPLLRAELGRRAVKANEQGRYFSTKDKKLYGQYLKIAEQDRKKPEGEKRVLVFPASAQFDISGKENPKFFVGAFENKDAGQDYLDFIEQDSIGVYLVKEDIVNEIDGTIVTPVWLAGLGYRSALNCYNRGLDCGNRVRGVSEKPALAGSQNFLYTSKDLREADSELETLEGLLQKKVFTCSLRNLLGKLKGK